MLRFGVQVVNDDGKFETWRPIKRHGMIQARDNEYLS